MRLIFKPSLEGLSLPAEIVARAPLDVDEDPGKANPLKVRAVLSVEGFAAGPDKVLCAGMPDLMKG